MIIDDKHMQVDLDYDEGITTVTEVGTDNTAELKIEDFEVEKQVLINLDYSVGDDKQKETLHFYGSNNEVDFSFYFKNANRKVRILSEPEYKLHHFMAPPKVIDASSIISPMPGKIVSVSVAVGEEVEEGQELCVIEAMKMQNIIKAERKGVLKTVSIKDGENVDVDQVLIEFQ